MIRMKGSGSEGGTIRVLIHEHATGGLAGRDLPASWVVEGAAIWRAIVEDFAAVPGVRVVATLGDRSTLGPPPGVEVVAMAAGDSIDRLAALADCTVLVAPESDGLLAEMTRAVEEAGGKHLGSGPEAVALVTDKARLAAHFQARGIPTPPTRVFETSSGPPCDGDGSIVVKPIDGAGSLDTFVVRAHGPLPAELGPGRRMLAQPYIEGPAMSASFLVDRDGRASLIAVGRQRIEVDADGRIGYEGGTVPAATLADLAVVVRAVESVPGLRGFVGVDFVDARGGAVVLEINPRPTTSSVGLARILPPGTIAGAWLAAASAGLAETGWPERLRAGCHQPPVAFGADGSMRLKERSAR